MSGTGKKDFSKLFQSTGELEKPEVSEVKGTIPSWLRGSFLRVGPGKFDLGDFTLNHWLDGYAVLTKFQIKDKRVIYTKKFLQSDSYKRALKSQRPVVTEFGTKAYPEKGKGFFARLVSAVMPELSDNGIGNIYKMGNKIFVMNDSCFFRNIDPCTLATGDKFDGGKIFGVNGLTAHPLTDNRTGETYNIGFSVISGIKFCVVKVPALKDKPENLNPKDIGKEAEVVCSFPSSFNGGVSFVHSFGMTDKYIIVIEQPYTASVTAIPMTLMKGYSVKDWFEWKPHLRNRFHIIDKESGRVIKTEYASAEPFFFLHFVNCFYDETANQLVVDLMAMDDPGILDGMYLSKLRSNIVEKNSQPECRRFILPLVNTSEEYIRGQNYVQSESTFAEALYRSGNKFTLFPDILTEPGCDMPSINKKYFGHDYSYVYVTGTIAQNTFSNAICKIDVKENRVVKEWKGDQYLYPGEPLFVSRTHSEAEDDGVIIATVTDIQKGHQDFIVVIHAKSMEELGRASFKEHIPGALHGIFIPDS